MISDHTETLNHKPEFERQVEVTRRVSQRQSQEIQRSRPACGDDDSAETPVQIEDALMDAPGDRLADEAGDVAVDLMSMGAQMRRKASAYVARLHDTLHHMASERLARMLQRSGAHMRRVQSRGEIRSKTTSN